MKRVHAFAGVAQLVEHQPSKLIVARSSRVARCCEQKRTLATTLEFRVPYVCHLSLSPKQRQRTPMHDYARFGVQFRQVIRQAPDRRAGYPSFP